MQSPLPPDELELVANQAGLLLPPYLLEEAQARRLQGESHDQILAALRAPADAHTPDGPLAGRDVPESAGHAFLRALDERLGT
jgi:hypothetical protein